MCAKDFRLCWWMMSDWDCTSADRGNMDPNHCKRKSIKKSLPLQLCCNRVKRKNTPTKQAVLALLTESGKAMSQDTIEERITIKINQATIYRILNQFCEDGMRWSWNTGQKIFVIFSPMKQNMQKFTFIMSLCFIA